MRLWKAVPGRSLLTLALAALLLGGCTGRPAPAPTPTAPVTPTAAPTAAPTPSPSPTASPTAAPSPSPSPAPEEERVTAESLIRQYIEEHKIPLKQIEVGYYNTATGEEAYVNGDVYLEAASMYKVALCMYWTEKIGKGELSWDQFLNGYQLEYAIRETLVQSNNDTAGCLLGAIGSYKAYRRAMIPFYGDIPEEEMTAFCKSSALTPRQMIHALRMLAAEPERYPRVLEYMLEAKPNEYFKYRPLPWEVAHKYGYLPNGGVVVNDCGVIYTEDPFLLVVMTDSLGKHQLYMNELCRLLGDYTEGRLPGDGATAAGPERETK